MNQSELIEAIRYDDIPKLDVEAVIMRMKATIKQTLADGKTVFIRDLGTFATVDRAARKGRNPATGKAIEIPAHRAVKFTPAKALSDAMNPARDAQKRKQA